MSHESPSAPSANQPAEDHVRAILAALGGQPVLLPIHAREKGPRWDRWERLTWEQTQDPETVLEFSATRRDSGGEEVCDEKGATVRDVYRRGKYADLLPIGNIGVLLGRASRLKHGPDTYHLCSIDVDESDSLEPFLDLNPRLRGSLITQGKRGANVWLWVLAGSYPPFAKIKRVDGEAGTDGKGAWGEWRADGELKDGKQRSFQTVIYGLHPEGMRYRRISEAAKPLLIDFNEIVWPEGLAAAFIKTPFQRLVEEHGEPWRITKKGGLTLNPPFFVGKYAMEHRVLFEPEEGRFYDYLAERGLWCVESEDMIRWKFSRDLKAVADDAGAGSALETKRTNATLQGLASLLKGAVEKRSAFEREAGIVHLANGMLDVRATPPTLSPFAASYFSRNQVPWALDEKATCPIFIEKLVKGGIKLEADISLVKRWAGQLLLGKNLTQKIMLFTGQAGAGKSTLINVFSKILGQENVSGLRTEHLHQRFELWNYVGKTFLIGADVPGNFLMTEGAHVLKALVGKDVLTAEKKNGDSVTITGEYNVGLTSNSRLRVRLDGDAAAWRRRLLIVNYDLPPPSRPDPQFLEKLLASEASGILNWMVEGALELLAEIRETGSMVLSGVQKDRVDSLLAESDSIREFVRKGLAAADGLDVTGHELGEGYVAFCEARGWTPLPTRKVEGLLPDAILEVHRASKRNDINRGGKNQRGYRGLRILPVDDRGRGAEEEGGDDASPVG